MVWVVAAARVWAVEVAKDRVWGAAAGDDSDNRCDKTAWYLQNQYQSCGWVSLDA